MFDVYPDCRRRFLVVNDQQREMARSIRLGSSISGLHGISASGQLPSNTVWKCAPTDGCATTGKGLLSTSLGWRWVV
jgi:hypothetical protein